ncbi:hypothetical protein HYV73_01350 [Candidatus Uhrbacteria bacterium]|nr:hypothetical protein [Candidatus Uhrbacteria bacterium]
MTEQELTQLLSRVKDAPTFGGDFSPSEKKRLWEKTAARLGFNANEKQKSYTLVDYLSFLREETGMYMHQFVPVFSVICFVLLGGWVASVQAATTVPGDVLYPVKLATERVQVSFASQEDRPALHAEFAQRRLDEVSEIQGSAREGKTELVRQAVEGFKKEIDNARQDLVTVQGADPKQAVEVAVNLNQKTDALAASLSQTAEASQTGVEVKEAVVQALERVAEASDQTIDTLVTTHEQQPEEETADQLKREFQEEVKGLFGRAAMDVRRAQTIAAVVESKTELREFQSGVEMIRQAFVDQDAALTEAMNIVAAGGYRAGFDRLKQIQQKLLATETSLTTLEIEITSLISASENVTEVESVETPSMQSEEVDKPQQTISF